MVFALSSGVVSTLARCMRGHNPGKHEESPSGREVLTPVTGKTLYAYQPIRPRGKAASIAR
jgi:hypothetical protein